MPLKQGRFEVSISENAIENTPALVNGTNIVAIDNKIEQAMDLVKTHLLYAVREEVEVLKERIVELESKIARLETENKLLRNHAPTEVIQFIQQQQQQQDQDQKPAVAGSLNENSHTLTASMLQQQHSGGGIQLAHSQSSSGRV